MTCIIAVEHSGNVTMGGDACGGDARQYTLGATSHAKIFQRQVETWFASQGMKPCPLLIGYTTSFRLGQLMEFFEPPRWIAVPVNNDPREYLIKTFVPELRKALKDGGFTTIEHNVETGGQLLLGFKGGVWELQADFSLLRYERGYAAIGCGAAYALGAVETLRSATVMSPSAIVRSALETTTKFSAYVQPPFTILTI